MMRNISLYTQITTPYLNVMTLSKLNVSGMHWVSELSDYNFPIKHRPGKVSLDCDYLSHTPVKKF